MYKINLTLQNIRCQFFKLFFGRQKCQTPELLRGGLRLAHLLNTIYDPDYKKAD